MMDRGHIEYTNPPAELAKAHTRGFRKGLKAGVLHWKKQFARLHFKRGAVGRYKYKRRDPIYNKRKLREKHTRKPLVWTGESMKALLGGTPKVSTSKKPGRFISRMTMAVPQHFIIRRETDPDKVDEFTRTLQEEGDFMAQIIMDTVEPIMRRAKRKIRKNM